jgi:hypothetical protein
MDTPSLSNYSNPLLNGYSSRAANEHVGLSLPSRQEPLNLTRTLRSRPQQTRHLGVNRCRLNVGHHPISGGPCQPLCDLCKGINIERLTQPGGYLHAGDMNSLNFAPDDPSKHCVMCSAFSWGIKKAIGSGNRMHRGKLQLRCRLANAATNSSNFELSNNILDRLSYKHDIAFRVYCDEGRHYCPFMVCQTNISSQVTLLRSLESKLGKS